MIASLGLMLALNANSDPFQVGPVNFAMKTDRIISMLGPVAPVTICDSANYSYSDADATVSFDGLTIRFTPHPSKTVKGSQSHPLAVPVARLGSKAPPIWGWRFMGYPIFAMADHLPGFVTARPRKGERLHLYRPGVTMREGTASTERIDYYLEADGTVVIARMGWVEPDL